MPAADASLPLGMKLFVIAIVAIGLVPAILLAIKAWRRPPLLQYEPRRPVPWGANDLVLVVLFVFLLGYILGATGGASQSAAGTTSRPFERGRFLRQHRQRVRRSRIGNLS